MGRALGDVPAGQRHPAAPRAGRRSATSPRAGRCGRPDAAVETGRPVRSLAAGAAVSAPAWPVVFSHAALATLNAEFYENRVFDPAAIAQMRRSLEPMATPWLQVHAVARERGIELITADRVKADGIDPRQVLLIAYDWTPDAERLVALGARPAALVSFEPPVIAWRLYCNLGPLSLRF